jgi:uncharacterized lipoprotein YddW (UPF0748 family)
MNRCRRCYRILGLCVLWSILVAPWPGAHLAADAAPSELRGIWMHATQIKTRAEADRFIRKIDEANLNAVFVLVWYWGGQAFYESRLCPMGDGVEPGYDPLAYLAEGCHRRKIEVHAWFVNGEYGSSRPRHVLDVHPDWAMQSPEGSEFWYDFGKPEVRKFQSDLMVECLRSHEIDGIHFDYIRYAGPHLCLCKHCQEQFAREYGFEPLTGQSLAGFPFVTSVGSNPVVAPSTAVVAAEFPSGVPAIALNELGKGKVLLLNWHAEQRIPGPVAETVKRTFARWGATSDKLFVMSTAPTRERYGTRSIDDAVESLRRMGYGAKPIDEDRLTKLPRGATLVLPGVYYIPGDVAREIERFVEQGGTALVIDGPVFAMGNPSIQRILGMRKAGAYFSGLTAIQATGRSDLVISSGRKLDLEKEKLRGERWVEYRKKGVTALVRDVYRRAKALKPQAQVTAAVFTPLASAEAVCQEWPSWLREGILDYAIPMAYTADNRALAGQFREWRTIDPDLERIVPGLSIYAQTAKGTVTRDLQLILTQHRMSMEQRFHGNNYFSLHNLSEPLIEALKSGPYKEKVPAYRPPARKGT